MELRQLRHLLAIVEHGSFSRAAERVNLSQPAMSAALARLREYFGDDLLVLQGKRMHPTAFADELMPQVKTSLRQLEAMLAKSPNFDPATSQRTFRIVTSDYVQASIIVPLVAELAAEAPGILLDCQLPNLSIAEHLDEGSVDVVITPEYIVTGSHPSYELYREPQVVVGASENPVLAKGYVTAEEFEAAGHVAVVIGERPVASYADRQLELMGISRRIEVTTSVFMLVPWLVERTDRLAMLHERLVVQLEGRFAIRRVPAPYPVPAMKQMLCYHAGREEDAGLLWLRSKIERIARTNP